MPLSTHTHTSTPQKKNNASPVMIYQASGAQSLDLRSALPGGFSVALSNQAAAPFLLLLVTDGTTCSCRHRPGRCPCRLPLLPNRGCYCKERVTPLLESSGCKLPLLYMHLFCKLVRPSVRKAKENQDKHPRQHRNKGQTPPKGKTCDLETQS